MLNPGDLVFIKDKIHLWEDVEISSHGEGDRLTYHPLQSKFASVTYAHSTNPDWYFILLFEPFTSQNGRQVWTGWAYLPWGHFQKNYFEIVQ